VTNKKIFKFTIKIPTNIENRFTLTNLWIYILLKNCLTHNNKHHEDPLLYTSNIFSYCIKIMKLQFKKTKVFLY